MMSDVALLKPKLSRLKLSGIRETLSVRLEQATQEQWSYSEFLDVLVSDEVERRDAQQLSRRLAKSGLAAEKTLETFDFTYNPRLHQSLIRELALLRFVDKGENVFFLGPSGTGKSHLAQALGHEACRRGYEVWCRRTLWLFKWLTAGKGDGSYERRLKQLSSLPLLIMDDFALQPLTEDRATLKTCV